VLQYFIQNKQLNDGLPLLSSKTTPKQPVGVIQKMKVLAINGRDDVSSALRSKSLSSIFFFALADGHY
jgi:hypothetical protein